MSEGDGVTVRFDYEELEEVRRAVSARRHELESVRTKMEKAGLSTFVADDRVEVLDRVNVAIGDEPEDMFSGLTEENVDPDTGEILDE